MTSVLSSGLLRLAAAAALGASLFACVIDNEPDHHYSPGGVGGVAGPPPSGAPAGTTSGASPSPMLVVVDTNQTMAADPGQGVGVFIEYAAGGKWHVWWTCDTAKSGQTCDFKVSASAATGNITNVDQSQLQGGTLTQQIPSRVDAAITTSNAVNGVSFQTDPGAVVTIEASASGLEDGSLLFFVQDGKVNGGYTGKLTDPLQVQGSTP